MRYAALYGDFEYGTRGEVAALRRRTRRYRRSLRQCRRRLAREGAERDRALAAICHDLRAPLQAILAWVHLARGAKSGAGPDLDEALGAIERNARRQAALIDDLLDLARGANGEDRIERTTVDLNDLAAAALDVVRPAAGDKGIELDCQPSASPALVQGDRAQLQRVIWNLLGNAVKFTPPGGRVSLNVRADGPDVGVSVSDTGRGVRSEFLPRIFEPFAQDDPDGTRTPGVGLGLAIVRQLIDSHAGRVEAASAGEGLGTTFTVTLPKAPSGE